VARLRVAIEMATAEEGFQVEIKPVRLPLVLGAVLLGWEHLEDIVDVNVLKNLEHGAHSLP